MATNELDELKKTSFIGLRVSDKDVEMLADIRRELYYNSNVNFTYSEVLRMALERMFKQIKK